jgi:hypothetical protein
MDEYLDFRIRVAYRLFVTLFLHNVVSVCYTVSSICCCSMYYCDMYKRASHCMENKSPLGVETSTL